MCPSDALGTCHIEALQYVDDTTVPCSSPGAVRSIVNRSHDTACARYAVSTKSSFHFGKNKTCAMALLNSPPLDPATLDCEVVQEKVILGVLFDSQLTFGPLLSQMLARLWAMFVDLFHAAETGGFSVPVLVAQVVLRLHPHIFGVAPFIALVPGVVGKLNQLQWRWGKTILGCRYQRELKWHLVVAQCGWEMRLGTCLILELALAVARVFLLPKEHPTARLMECLQGLPCHTWFSQVRALFEQSDLHQPIPSLEECDMFGPQEIQAARDDAVLRKKILRKYRVQVVRPILLEYDRRNLVACTSVPLAGCGSSLSDLGYYTLKLDWELFDIESPRAAWFEFRAWSLTRVTARWPLPLLGLRDMPLNITCPGCGAQNATILHLLCRCAVVEGAYANLAAEIPACPRRTDERLFLQLLYGEPEAWRQSQKFVGSCFRIAFS